LAVRGRGVQTQPTPNVDVGSAGGGLFGWLNFGSPTVKKTPTPTPQTPPQITTVPTATYTPTGTMQMQGGTRGQPTTTTTTQKTYCMMVYGQKMQLTSDAINWYIDNGVDVRPCTETPTSNGNLEARVARLEQYPQAVGTASQKSDQDIWNHLDEHVWNNPPYNNPNAIYPQLQKVIKTQQSLGDALQSAYEHRTSIEGKLEGQITEHGDFHTKLQALGDAGIEAKSHRDSLEKKLEEQRKHTHNSPPDDEENCGWFGEKCWIETPDLSWLKWVLLAVGIGVLLWLLRPIFNLIGIFKGGAI